MSCGNSFVSTIHKPLAYACDLESRMMEPDCKEEVVTTSTSTLKDNPSEYQSSSCDPSMEPQSTIVSSSSPSEKKIEHIMIKEELNSERESATENSPTSFESTSRNLVEQNSISDIKKETKLDMSQNSSFMSSQEIGFVIVSELNPNSVSGSTNEHNGQAVQPVHELPGDKHVKRKKKLQPVPPRFPPKSKRKPKRKIPSKDSNYSSDDDDYTIIPANQKAKNQKQVQKKLKKSTKADIEVLNDMENPRPSTSAALVSEMARLNKLLETCSNNKSVEVAKNKNKIRKTRSTRLDPIPKPKIPVRSARNLRVNSKIDPKVLAPKKKAMKNLTECQPLIQDTSKDENILPEAKDEPTVEQPKNKSSALSFNGKKKRPLSAASLLQLQRMWDARRKKAKKLNEPLEPCSDDKCPSPVPVPAPATPAIQTRELRLRLVKLKDEEIHVHQKKLSEDKATSAAPNSEPSQRAGPKVRRGRKRRQPEVQTSINLTKELIKVEPVVPSPTLHYSVMLSQLSIVVPVLDLAKEMKRPGTKAIKNTVVTLLDTRKSVRPRKPRSIIDL